MNELIPELARWNNGNGMAVEDWIWLEGRADHALAFCSLLWPDLIEFEGYVLRAPLDTANLRDWEDGDLTRSQIEIAMNAFLLDDAFPEDPAADEVKEAQCSQLATIMVDMLKAKLARDFPDRRFCVFVLTGDDIGVSFHQH